jgi:serine phosphatase RsbU (regulator of sigma subunit)
MSPTPRSSPGDLGGLITTLRDDVNHVVDDIRTQGFERAVAGTLSSLEAFYLTDRDRRELAEMPPLRRLFRRVLWFIRGLLMKLTPARRIMLAAALLFLALGIQRVEFETFRATLRFQPIGTLLILAVLTLELKDKLTARDELEAGRKVQMALLPDESPAIPGWDVWLYTQPANDVGGDLVDHLPLGRGRHGVALGDVAGKALPAALLSVKLQATLRALGPEFEGLGDLGAAVNRILQRDGLPTRFASLVYLVVAPDSGEIRVLNAGHMPPLVARGADVTTLERGGVVLGIMPDSTYSEQRVELAPGDVLIAYSDGVSEATNEQGEFFGDERLYRVAVPPAGLSARAIGLQILDDVRRFMGREAPKDDISLMVLKRIRNV